MAESEGPDWSRLENLPAIALEHLDRWGKAVKTQSLRASDPNQGMAARVSDAYLFTQALRQVIRAAELLADTLEDEAQKNSAKAAVNRFKASIPDAVHIRDILDHFDDYARGIGNISIPKGTPRKAHQPTEDSARMFEPHAEIDHDRISIRCGSYSIDISKAAIATNRLVSDLFDSIGFVVADEQSMMDSIGDLNFENPFAVMWMAFHELIRDDFGKEAIENLRRFVMPETLDRWGDFNEARLTIQGYGLGSVPDLDGDIAYVALVPEPSEGRVATQTILILNALWATLVYRPDLEGGWYLYHIGQRLSREDIFPN